jgi:hypothetical protein
MKSGSITALILTAFTAIGAAAGALATGFLEPLPPPSHE